MPRIGWPGEFPFTRGLYPTGYRGRTWTIRQFAGFGNAAQTNERYKMILAAGGGGLTRGLRHADADGPRLRRPAQRSARSGTAGWRSTRRPTWRCCSPASTSAQVTTSMTICGPAVPVFCMYLVAAERQGVDLGTLNGTLQTDIFKEYIAQKEWLFAPEPHLRLIGDLMEYCAARDPALQAAVGVAATTSARPARRPRRSWRSPWPTGSATSSSGCPAGWTSTRSRPG